MEGALRRLGHLDGFELRAGRARCRALALPQQVRVLVRRARRRARLRLPSPRKLGRGDRRRGLPARLGGQQHGPQPGPRLGAGRGDPGLRSAPPGRGCCATSSSARAGEPGRCRPGSSPRRRASQAPRRSPHRGRGTRAAAPPGPPESSARSSSPRSWRGLRFESPPSAFFQTNTEMAERLYAIAAELAALSGRERVFDLYCGIGTIGLVLAPPCRRGLGHRGGARGGRRRRGERAAQRDRQRALHRRGRAARSCVPCSSGPAART